MPHKHTIKTYVKDGVYHVYNRGVDKRTIFKDKQDYDVFLHLLKYYLSPKEEALEHPLKKYEDVTPVRIRPLKNLHKEIDLISYCLMHNHFHLLLKQNETDSMTKLMRRLTTTYAMYFNKRNKRSGYLFQGRYKAALVDDEVYLLQVSRYIHLNPKEISLTFRGSSLSTYPYSSYPYFLREKYAEWVKPELILNLFKVDNKLPFIKYHTYRDFVENNPSNPEVFIGDLSLE
jgi:putative transposase